MNKIIYIKDYFKPVKVKFLIPYIKPELNDNKIRFYTICATINGESKTFKIKTDYSLISKIMRNELSIEERLDNLYDNTFAIQEFGRFTGDLEINIKYWIEELSCLYPVLVRKPFCKPETLYYPVKVYEPKKECFLKFEEFEPECRAYINIPEKGMISINPDIKSYDEYNLFIRKGTGFNLTIDPISRVITGPKYEKKMSLFRIK